MLTLPCPACDFVLSCYERSEPGSLTSELVAMIRREADDHERVHRVRVAAYEELGFRPATQERQAQLKAEGWTRMSAENPLPERVQGALLVVEALWARALNEAIDAGAHREFPALYAFLGTLDLERFLAADVAAHLRRRFNLRED